MRRNIGSGYPGEDEYGYSRAVRIGNQVFMSGTTARGAALELDSYGQSKDALATIEKALAEAGASIADVVKNRGLLDRHGQHRRIDSRPQRSLRQDPPREHGFGDRRLVAEHRAGRD